nr:integrase, catalytic region, zinc finger, CCHC-type, peptidase aspartic, catalytic [Tanacetum cinerariifolium]
VIPHTSVSRPQLKSKQTEDRVMLNNSQGKKQEVEDHSRNVKFSKNKTSVTACNDSLNAKISNVNFVCATCGKYVLNVKHDMCVLKSRTDMNSRTKMPMIVPLVEIILFIVDSGCSKHMTGNLKLLINFVEKYLGTVKFGNDQIARIIGYGDLVQGAITIKRVYYVEGLNHNLFSIGQFCNADLEVAFQKSTCYIRDLKGNDLLPGSRGTDLYSITLQDTTSPNPICLMAKATSLIQGGLHAQVRTVRTDKGTEFLNKTLHVYFATEGINHQTSVARTPEKTADGENLDKIKEKVVSKSSVVTSADVSNQCQQQHTTPLNNQTTTEPSCQVLTQAPTVTSTENITQAETIKENAQVENDEFVNIFYTPTKDHPLEQVIGNPSQSVRTRRQLESDGEMCMFALTEELHQFDRLDVWELVDRPLCKNVINMKWL